MDDDLPERGMLPCDAHAEGTDIHVYNGIIPFIFGCGCRGKERSVEEAGGRFSHCNRHNVGRRVPPEPKLLNRRKIVCLGRCGEN